MTSSVIFFWIRLANAFELAQALFGDHLLQRLAQGLDRARGILVGAGLEWVLTLQLQQRRNADQHFCYLVLVHAWNMVFNLQCSKPKSSPRGAPPGRVQEW